MHLQQSRIVKAGFNKTSHWNLFDLERVKAVNQKRTYTSKLKGKRGLFSLVKSLFSR